MAGHFKILQLQGNKEKVLTCLHSIAHMLRIIKKVVGKKGHVFHVPDNHSNKIDNADVINNVMTFLTFCFKVQTVYSFKTSYFHE